MKSMHLLLNEAEKEWRDDVRRDFPKWGNTQVVRNSTPDGRDWSFSTDLTKIYATISNDENLQKGFEEIITKYWDDSPEILAKEVLHYLLHHELYHPIEAPFSISGEDNDNKRIHQAIRKGLLKAEPGISPLEQVVKVQASQNGVKDFILDNRFDLDNKVKNYVRNDIIPIWDVLELKDASPQTNFYTITRVLYGMLYGPESVHAFFQDKAGKEGLTVAEKALSSLTEKPLKLPKAKNSSILGKVKSLFGKNSKETTNELLQGYSQLIRDVFAGDNRYNGIERLMSVLGPYIEKGMSQGRPSVQGGGTSSQSILQDLLDDMSPGEQEQFVHSLSQEGQEALEEAALEVQQSQKPQNDKPISSSADQMKNLDLLATHEFYKRNHPKVTIIGSKKVGETVVVGKQQYWDLKKSTVLTEDQLSKLNLSRIGLLQKRTRLPWLIGLGNGSYRLNEYELKQRNIKDINYVDAHLDVPEVVELYVDSSGSMFKYTAGIFRINDGNGWDMLSHVTYGLTEALQQGGRKIGKKTYIRIHNVADKQVSSRLISVDDFLRGDIETLTTFFKPNNGYDQEDLNLTNYTDGKQRAYMIVTDGNLVINGRTAREAKKMDELAKNPQNTVALFEIGGTYDLGNAVKNNPNIVYQPVHDKEKMLQAGLKVLLSK